MSLSIVSRQPQATGYVTSHSLGMITANKSRLGILSYFGVRRALENARLTLAVLHIVE